MIEHDQILVPTGAGYRTIPLMNLLGVNVNRLRSMENAGLAPVRFITQRGPYQDGESVLDLRFETRVIQMLIAERLCTREQLWDRRADLLDYLRPNRSFLGSAVNPLVYRKYLPGGGLLHGTDLITENGSALVVSNLGRFVDRGGVQPGAQFTILSGADAGNYTIVSVPNDYTLELSANLTTDANQIHYAYRRGAALRDLYVLLEQGPNFDWGPDSQPFAPQGYSEALRFVAHDPFFYGDYQTQTWGIDDVTGDLVFDLAGAWFGVTPGVGRWLFATSYVGQSTQVVYWGTTGAKPIITITGPAIDPVIENTTINTRIELTYSIAAGEQVTIDTLSLTATNNFGVNLLPYLTGDLATFELSPDPQAPAVDYFGNFQRGGQGGVNNISVSFSGATFGSTATLTWRNRYVGI